MEKSQKSGESLSDSKQLPSLTYVETKLIELPQESQGIFAALKRVSLKTQIFAIAFAATVVCPLSIIVSQSLIPNISTVWIAGISVGVTMLLLGQLTINQINRGLDNLKAQLAAIAQGDLTVQAIDSPQELKQLVSSFNQMTQAIQSKLNEAQQKVAEQKIENEELQQKLLQIIDNLDFTGNNSLQATIAISEDNELPVSPQGSLLEFLDNFHKWSQLPTAPELLFGSSTLEEIQQRQEQLQYRQVWLQAIMEETQREITLIAPIAQLAEPNNHKEINEG